MSAVVRPLPIGLPAPAALVKVVAGLRGETDRLAEELTEVLLENEPLYQEGEARVPREDLYESVRGDIDLALAFLAGDHPLGFDPEAQREIGERRAEQGLPLESLLRSYRLGARGLWMAIVERAELMADVDSTELLRGATVVWDLTDQMCSAVAHAYRDAAASIARRNEMRRDALFDALLDGRGGDVTVAREAAMSLFLPAQGPYIVVVCEQPLTAPTAPELVLRHAGLSSAWRLRGDRQIGVVALGRRAITDLIAALTPHVSGRTGLSPAGQYLSSVAELAAFAELALRTLKPGASGLERFEDRMFESLLVSAPDVAERIAKRTLAGILELEDEPSRNLLLDTLDAYFANGGTVALAAEKLFCHRNTVLNRLRRAEELTGLALNDPLDLAKVVVALRAHRLLDRDNFK